MSVFGCQKKGLQLPVGTICANLVFRFIRLRENRIFCFSPFTLARRLLGVSRERPWPPGSNPMQAPDFWFIQIWESGNTRLVFFRDFWITMLARCVFGVSKERSWPPGSNCMHKSGFPAYPNLKNWKNQKNGNFKNVYIF